MSSPMTHLNLLPSSISSKLELAPLNLNNLFEAITINGFLYMRRI